MDRFQREFPDYPAASLPVIPAHWIDESWRNEACPFWQISPSMGVYVDYPDATQREFPENERFIIVPLDNRQHCDGEGRATDEWRDVLAAEYEARIGYNPFTDDPTMTVEAVAQTLAEYVREAGE
ncbi:hypothetical protein [Novosphingobium resinovorum]|uniref:Uncharacterized protein n=1 Tax=Novosphingobium resinovorum TaxID=158500 RepID=A0A1D8A387_9SPHN|nr:hypothetical protein [Novosphingobium resinovorum]AOR76522.1 hypothetical protein BES08_07030 [Novosphingobium resinovorum]